MFKPPVAKPPFSEDLKAINKRFIILRNQVFFFAVLSYVMYYFTRRSVDFTGSALVQAGVLDAFDFGVLGAVFAITYGLSKFLVGNFADRSSGRVVMSFGLLMSAIINLALGGVIQIYSTKISIAPIVMMSILLVALGVFQGMGWPATARMFSHWFTDEERSTRIALWNSGHGLGSAILPLIVIALFQIFDPNITILGLYYWFPSIIALAFVPVVWWGLRDRPEACGLPTVEKWKGLVEHTKEKQELNWKEIFMKYVLKNKFIWILAFANIWVYVLRQGISFWNLTIVKEVHGIKIDKSGILWSFFEWAGIVGGITAAYFSKWFFQNRKAPLMILGLLITIGGLVLFQNAPKSNMIVLSAALIISGFGVYMPQAMIGATAIELTNKKAAATASGFTGLFGYFGDAVMSKLVVGGIFRATKNWDIVFYYFYGAAVLAVVALAFLWTKNQDDKLV